MQLETLHTATQLIRENQRQWILQTVREFDPQAEVFLFGPGTKHPGRPVDLYIKSQQIDAPTRQRIHQQLTQHHHLKIDLVCEMTDQVVGERIETTKEIVLD